MMSRPHSDAVHPEPVWRGRSDFIISAVLPEGRSEQLWARQIDDRQFELCCIPFFLFDLSLGDVVETDAEYAVTRVVERSGRYTFRVWFGESSHPRDEVVTALTALGTLTEWSSLNLLAVDATDANHAQIVADFLQERADLGQLLYETGRSG
jgi:hypothetical protein